MTDKIDFDQNLDRSHSDSIKWARYVGTDILPLWVADTDFLAAPAIIEALQARVAHGVFGYSKPSARLNQLVVERMQRLYQWQVDPSWIVWLPGVVAGMHLACRSIGSSGDGVLTPSVIYPHFLSTPGLSDRRAQPVPMKLSKQRMVIDFGAMEQLIDAECKMLLFCNPQNPGGAVYTEAELRRLAEILVQHDLYLCSDEIHCDLIYRDAPGHIPIATLGDAIAARSITLMAPSKTFNVAGLACSFAIIADDQLRRRFKHSAQGIISDLNLFGLVAAEAAYQSCDDWNQQLLDYLQGNRDYLLREINSIRGLKLDPIEATYLAWIDVSELGLDDASEFFEKAGVGLSPGKAFGDARFMRLNFGCPRARLEQAVTRIRLAVSDYWAS